MKPSDALRDNRQVIREIVSNRRLANPRVYGSVLRGEDRADSDLDILVDAMPGTTLLTLGGLQGDLEAALGVRVDVKVPGDFPPRIRDRIIAEAVAI
ncbi:MULTISPECIES: nucleotidyltransferase family protein [Rhizobium]|uniref:Nucleotidyltransferase domain-containing protein n=1 Tax=Rhizobium rhododendri TaxID=2506430 RepID=A0ABY8IEI9_9HYPH|nr:MULTISPECIES: nucleotidyltransferase domain-containing protein [Rhizobium]MBZ5758777.1 nucleotidyltransferase domain-containing protein [Rhizobium sp. VS19-DR96]MBZ5764393.1 nucleotidyltransferase domain-containing protein [Rhizobium sp. VS19-DR129.2]MBZ5771936.1 nucleotidyltransferase domain-containing protein [Rhizobium sp. VS19-DRK62.2]MBZ5783377.1 nucleotidyltransferase domain-containing protein [Rhizobium sp. VS19-DR121]MBZ5800825.1 nucleotidyltransferase domain-containing protein [Rhi